MSWQDVLSYVKNFLRWREKTKPSFPIPVTAESFTEILRIWQENLGRSLLTPVELNSRVARHLEDGTYGIMILTDIVDDTYATFAKEFRHDGPTAYVVGIPRADGMNYKVQWYKPPVAELSTTAETDKYAAFFDAPKLQCDAETFGNHLCGGAKALWLDVLRPGLVQLGWDNRGVGGMGFEVRFVVNGTPVALLLVGWPERDAKNIARDLKRAGSAGIRVNPHIKRLFRASNSNIDFANKWMKRFYGLGWRGRPAGGMRERWGVKPIGAHELESKVQGIMQYEPDPHTRDHIGRPGDRESLLGLLTGYSELLAELQNLKT
jgi:hypothetical protein